MTVVSSLFFFSGLVVSPIPKRRFSVKMLTLLSVLRPRVNFNGQILSQALELFVHAAKEEGDAACGYRVSLMALKCINNAIWDQPSGQLVFVRLGGMDMLVTLMQARLAHRP